jgi:hypothetical protein
VTFLRQAAAVGKRLGASFGAACVSARGAAVLEPTSGEVFFHEMF